MDYLLSESQILNLCMKASEWGAIKALKNVGLYNDEISQREAFRTYGEANVRTWESRKLIKGIPINDKKHSKKLYSKEELEKLKEQFNTK